MLHSFPQGVMLLKTKDHRLGIPMLLSGARRFPSLSKMGVTGSDVSAR